MNRVRLLLIAGMLVLPVGALAQTPQSKEPLLLQLYEDASRSRQNMEVESAACKVQVKDLQQQLQAATEKKDTKETKEKK